MKNGKFRLGILVIVLVFGINVIGCLDAGAGGTQHGSAPVPGGIFTLTNIPSQFNGNYVILDSFSDGSESDGMGDTWGVGGFQDIGNQTASSFTLGEATMVQISNGIARIPMWIMDEVTDTCTRYTGNHTLEVGIVFGNNSKNADWTGKVIGGIGVIELEFVTFSNGSATRSFTDGSFYDWDDYV